MAELSIFDGALACVACDVARPAATFGWQMLFCGVMSGVVLIRIGMQDFLGMVAGDRTAPQEGDSGEDRKLSRPASHGKGPAPPRGPIRRLLNKDLGGSARTALAMLSAVQLGGGEFIRNAAPSPDITAIPSSVAVKLLIALQVLPFLVLLGLDIWIAKRYSAKTLRRYRSTVFAIAILLVLRQIELYFAPVKTVLSEIDSVSPVLVACILYPLLALAAWLAFKALKGVTTFLAYFSPAALVMLLVMTVSQPNLNRPYEDYNFAEVIPGDPSGRPVFVILFDELAYDALLDPTGEIDAELYPNFARLGKESLQFTNAASNYFRTWLQVPELIDPIVPLGDRYELRLYEQTQAIEAVYAAGCGEEYTCRGLRYFTQQSNNEMATYIGMRAAYHVVPSWVEDIASAPLGFLAKQVGAPPPPADPLGIHEVSTALLNQYLVDIASVDTSGRIFFLHTLLPHYPFVFDEQGDFAVNQLRDFPRDPRRPLSDDEFATIWAYYREQIQYADSFLGEVFARLDAAGTYDDAVILVTSDHGARPLFPMWGEAIPIDRLTTGIPLFIHAPDVELGKTDIEYQHIDFGPTLYELVGQVYDGSAVDAPRDGSLAVSVFDPVRPERVRSFFVDYERTRYWRHTYDEDSDTWRMTDAVEGSIWDRSLIEPAP